jgi:hypothetical protein
MHRFDRRLGDELRREFDAQIVHTPPPQRARYARPPRQRPPIRAFALVTAVFALGILVGLVYTSGGAIVAGPGRQLGVVPPGTPTAQSTAAATPQASARPSPPATRRPSPSLPPTGIPAVPPRPAPPSLADDFEADPVGANPPAGWLVGDGEWAGVADAGGHVLRHEAGAAAGHLVAGAAGWTDYRVSARVGTGLLGLGTAGVAGRYQDPGNDYECVVSVGGQVQLSVVQNGQRRSLGTSGIALDLSGGHDLSLDLRGDRLTCSLDGTPLVRATDATFAAGRVALVASAGSAADFDDVRVTA